MVSRLVVMGGTGMLGTAVASHAGASGLPVLITARDPKRLAATTAETVSYDAARDHPRDLRLRDGDVVINCIGVIRHLMDDDDPDDRERAIEINARFPYRLAAEAEAVGARIIQIATDCVFSGHRGRYTESDAHDAVDVYGQTKSLGEVPSPRVLNLRCSIIGPENGSTTSLQEWVLAHPAGAELTGYTDHRWNGVTTAAFARVVVASASDAFPSGTHHLVPADEVTKAQLCELILDAHGRSDVRVVPVRSSHAVDRTLGTDDPDVNRWFWRSGGWSAPPSIAEMVGASAAPRAHPAQGDRS